MPILNSTISQGNVTSPLGAHLRYGKSYNANTNNIEELVYEDYNIVFVPEDEEEEILYASQVVYVPSSDSNSLTGANVQLALNQLNNKVNNLVFKSGDTMLGPLILHANPEEDMQAATKLYVDETIDFSLAAILEEEI